MQTAFRHRGALFAVLFILGGFAQAVNGITGTSIGDLVHLSRAIGSVVMALFDAPTPSGLPVVAKTPMLRSSMV